MLVAVYLASVPAGCANDTTTAVVLAFVFAGVLFVGKSFVDGFASAAGADSYSALTRIARKWRRRRRRRA